MKTKNKVTVASPGKCECDLCVTGRTFMRIIHGLPENERKWMSEFYNAAFETAAEFEMLSAHRQKPYSRAYRAFKGCKSG